MAPVTEMIMFQFVPGHSKDEIKFMLSNMLNLQHRCIDPKTGSPYILSMKGGLNFSSEDGTREDTYAFVLEFASEDHRDYFVSEDEPHQIFLNVFKSNIMNYRVIDISDGRYDW